nr:NADH dehydrogenase subunit 6 [Sarmydus sp. N117]
MSATIIISMLTLSIFFMFLAHPLALGLILLFQTIFIALITGTLSYNYWFSYLLFLIMVGGMLILFIYMTSVASNEKFKLSTQLLWPWVIPVMMIIPFMAEKFLLNIQMISYDNAPLSSMPNQNQALIKFFNLPLISNLLLIIIYLLITLIMTVKITLTKQGPLRQKF